MLSTFQGRVLAICPHFDDACFSMGGLLLKKTSQEATILTIFSKSVHAPNSKRLNSILRTINALRASSLTGLAAEIISKRRQKEDYRYCNSIGAIQTTLPFEDSSLRRPMRSYVTNDQDVEREPIYGMVFERIEKIILSNYYDFIFCPLAVGNQIDHLIVMKAVLQTLRKNKDFSTEVLFYEDLPYSYNVALDTISELARERSGSDDPIYVNITDEISIKRKLCRIYHTQAGTLVQHKIAFHNRRLYKTSYPRDMTVGYCERFWRYNRPLTV